MSSILSPSDQKRLRNLAKKQAELSQLPMQQQCISQWKALHRFQSTRPMVLLEMDTFEHEIIPPLLRCESDIARAIETKLLQNTLPAELFGDDFIVPDVFPLQWQTHFALFGLHIQKAYAEDSNKRAIGHQFQHVISDLSSQFDGLQSSSWYVDREATLRRKDFLDDILGDILPVKLRMDALYAVPTQHVVHMMGMENMLFAMMDTPDVFSSLMNRIADDYCAYFDFLQKEQLLLPTTDAGRLGQGTYCYTDELPNSINNQPLTTHDVWGFLDSQETVGISPEMFRELVFPCYQKIAERFGLLSYGCCEPVHMIWDNCISTLSNLRKVSVSPWCDQRFMGERLSGKRIVYHRKPSANYLGVGKNLDEDAIRAHIIETITAAKGCTLEFTQRDVYTIDHNPEKARRYIQIIRECIDTHWQP